MLFHFSSHAYLLYKRIWAFVGQIMLIGSKGSWAQFIFICQSHSARELYSAAKLYFTADLYSAADRFPLHFFLWTSLALWSSWWAFGPCFSLGFPPYGLLGMDQKMGIKKEQKMKNQQSTSGVLAKDHPNVKSVIEESPITQRCKR